MINFAFISFEYPGYNGKGGIGTYVLNASKMLVRHGFKVSVFCGSDKPRETSTKDGVLIYPIQCDSPSKFRIEVVKSFNSVHKITPFDIIESAEVNADGLEIKKCHPEVNLIVRMHTPNAIILKYKQVHTSLLKKARFVIGNLCKGSLDLGYWRKKAKNPHQDIEYQITSLADAISTPSIALKRWAINYWKLPETLISVIPNPVVKKIDTHNVLNAKSNQKKILFLGRMDAIKGVVNFTRAMKIVLHQYPDWKVVYAGSDSYFELKDKMYSSFILEELKYWKNQVIFRGSYTLSELNEILNTSSICVIPSYFESFSYTCTEAMSAGKAIVCSKLGAFPEIVKNNKEGLLINPYSSKQIARAVSYFIDFPSERKRMGDAAQIRTDIYSPQNVSEQFAKFYKSIFQ